MRPPTAIGQLDWAIRAPIEDAGVWRVLVTLANHADESGLAYPRTTTLADECYRSDRRARSALEWLEYGGYIARIRLRSGGRLRGYLYRVLVPGSPGIDPDILPVFASSTDLPRSWREPVPAVPSGHERPVTSGHERPVDQRTPASGQEPPTEEPPTGEDPATSGASGSDAEPEGPTYPSEVYELTREFARYVKANGHTMPSRGTKAADGWLREMDRLLRIGPPGDTGGDPPPEPAEVREVAHWALAVSDFWPANIRSVPKFREQYTRLRAQMRRGNGGKPNAAALAEGYSAAAQRLRNRQETR